MMIRNHRYGIQSALHDSAARQSGLKDHKQTWRTIVHPLTLEVHPQRCAVKLSLRLRLAECMRWQSIVTHSKTRRLHRRSKHSLTIQSRYSLAPLHNVRMLAHGWTEGGMACQHAESQAPQTE